MKMLLILSLLSFQAFAQTTTSAGNTSQFELPTFSFARLKEKFKINYFSETLGPSMAKWDDNEVADDGSKLRQPMTMYHSFSTRYLMTKDFNLFLSPGFTMAIGDRNDLRDNEEQQVLAMDDWKFGVLNSFVKTPTFSYDQRLTHRAPFSKKSRNENIDSQIEWQHGLTYAATP